MTPPRNCARAVSFRRGTACHNGSVADSDALRSRRKRLCKAGDHSLCRRCAAARAAGPVLAARAAPVGQAGRRRFLDVWWPRIRASPLRGLVDVRRAFGAEAFTFANGSMIMLASGTEASDHGDTLHLAVIDEAWSRRTAVVEQALKPAML